MRMTSTDQKNFPKFAYYVRTDIPKVTSVPAIRAAFVKIGSINEAQLKSALVWGSGPSIQIVSGLGACGKFHPTPGSNILKISQKVVEDFENGKGIRNARAGRVYAVGVTLLHELIHWADNLNGIDRAGEEGNEFERAVYGGVIPC